MPVTGTADCVFSRLGVQGRLLPRVTFKLPSTSCPGNRWGKALQTEGTVSGKATGKDKTCPVQGLARAALASRTFCGDGSVRVGTGPVATSPWDDWTLELWLVRLRNWILYFILAFANFK